MSVKMCIITQPSLDTVRLECSVMQQFGKTQDSNRRFVSLSFLDCCCSLFEENGSVG